METNVSCIEGEAVTVFAGSVRPSSCREALDVHLCTSQCDSISNHGLLAGLHPNQS